MEEINSNAVTQQGQVGTDGFSDAMQATGAGQPEQAEEQGKERMYTQAEFQSELDRRIQQGIHTAREKWAAELEVKVKEARDEGEKLAAMTEKERQEAEREKERQEFAEEREQYRRERLEFQTAKVLAEKELPVAFAAMLSQKDAETTKSNIEVFAKAWSEALQNAVEIRMRGNTPTAAPDKSEDAFLNGFQRK